MIGKLISIRLRALVNVMGGKKKDGTVSRPSVGKLILLGILFLYLGATFAGLFTLLAIGFGITLLPIGHGGMYYGMFIIIAFSMVFIFSIFETKSELFECRDNELLLSMPIKPSHIVISRIATVLIYNYVEAALVMVPAIVVFALFDGSPLGIAGGILAYLLLPLFATALSSGVGYIVSEITKRIKNKTLITTLLSVGFLLAYFYVYFGFLGGAGMEAGGEESLAIPVPYVPVIAAIGSVAMMKPLPTVLFVILSLGAAYLAYRIISDRYFDIARATSVSSRTEYKAKKLVRRSALMALTGKELRRFFSSSVYILNAGTGVIFSVVLAVAAILNSGELVYLISELGMPRECISVVFVIGLVFCAGMNMLSASALSLEGKSLWIPKSMPLSTRTVLLSKLLPHLIVTVPATLVCSFLLMIAGKATPAEIPFYILTPALSNVMFALFGLLMNVTFPKLELINDAQAVKSSAAVFFTMIFDFLWSIVVSAVGIGLSVIGFPLLSHGAILLLTLLLSALFALLLFIPCVKKYDKLGV